MGKGFGPVQLEILTALDEKEGWDPAELAVHVYKKLGQYDKEHGLTESQHVSFRAALRRLRNRGAIE